MNKKKLIIILSVLVLTATMAISAYSIYVNQKVDYKAPEAMKPGTYLCNKKFISIFNKYEREIKAKHEYTRKLYEMNQTQLSDCYKHKCEGLNTEDCAIKCSTESGDLNRAAEVGQLRSEYQQLLDKACN